METQYRAMKHHLPYEITLCYLVHVTGAHYLVPCPVLTQARQEDTRFTYPKGMKS